MQTVCSAKCPVREGPAQHALQVASLEVLPVSCNGKQTLPIDPHRVAISPGLPRCRQQITRCGCCVSFCRTPVQPVQSGVSEHDGLLPFQNCLLTDALEGLVNGLHSRSLLTSNSKVVLVYSGQSCTAAVLSPVGHRSKFDPKCVLVLAVRSKICGTSRGVVLAVTGLS